MSAYFRAKCKQIAFLMLCIKISEFLAVHNVSVSSNNLFLVVKYLIEILLQALFYIFFKSKIEPTVLMASDIALMYLQLK